MRRRVIILAVLGLLILCAGIAFVMLKPRPAVGKFPPSFSEAERHEIISAARRDAHRQAFIAIRRGEFRGAWRWIANARRQTVRSLGKQPDGQIHVTFGIDEPGATDGYAILARYFMAKTNGHWIVMRPF